jgi:serine/threonine-protein kinase
MKPENVFLVGTGDGDAALQVKVLDFGISKLGSAHSSLTQTGMVMGTPAYMPPEQARGSRVDHRVDIYAVGAILYRALTGSKPFEDLDPVATLTAVIADEPRRPSTIERSIAPALELVIQQAMAKNPDDRYGSFAELEAALAELDPRGAEPPLQAGRAQTPAAFASAATLVAESALGRGSGQGSDANMAAGARPRLIVVAAGAALWLLASLLDAIANAVRVLAGTEQLTRSELVLSAVGALALLIAPGVYGLRYLLRRVWPITPRVIETASRLQRALLSSLCAYALIALAARVLATFAYDGAAPALSPGWSLIAFVLASAAAVGSWLLPQGRKRR